MSDVKVNGITYRIGKLSAKQQFKLSRKLLPLLGAIMPIIKAKVGKRDASGKEGNPVALAFSDFDSFDLIEPAMHAIASMNDADADTLIDLCMSAVQRQSGQNWAAVLEPRSQTMMFADIEMPQMIQLALEVIKENLAPFMGALPQMSVEGSRQPNKK